MILNLTDLSNEPLQGQIARQIRSKILSGELEAGYMLPSIRKLAREQKVSVITVQRGYELLEKDGLIISRRGKGYFVNNLMKDEKKGLSEEKLKQNLTPMLRVAIDEGMKTSEIKKIIDDILKTF